jgi:hypothetical protein
MSGNSFGSGVVYRPDHGSVSRFELNDLDAGAKTSGLVAGSRLAKGKRREHACGPAVGRFQFRFLLLKIEFFDDYGLTSQLRPLRNARSRIADDGSGLLFCFAIEGTVESSDVDQVPKTIRFRRGQMIGIEIHPHGARLRTSDLFDRLRLKANENPPTLCVSHKPVAECSPGAVTVRLTIFFWVAVVASTRAAPESSHDGIVAAGELDPWDF